MGNLITALLNSSNALREYDKAFNIIQRNIANVNTPGYVKQDVVVVADPLTVSSQSARSSYLEQAVRGQQELLGDANQRAADLSLVEAQFDLSSRFGVPGGLNEFFEGFSELAVNPNDPVARQGVLELAGNAAQSFNTTAITLSSIRTNVELQTRDSVTAINRLATRIGDINQQFRASAAASEDAGLDAELHAALEELSTLVNITVVRTDDGAANVYLAGQNILVIGDKVRPITADFSTPETVILDAEGQDITGKLTRGRLGALIEEKNTTLPGYVDDLNAAAAAFADAVNTTLAGGVDQNGDAPATDLFAYDAGVGAAATLSVNALTPDQIAAADPSAPGGNANAIRVAQLADQALVGEFTLTQYYGNLAGRVGRDVAAARQDQIQYQDTVTQTQNLRATETQVSLDEEAVRLLQFQRSYQAIGKMVEVLAELTQTVLGMLR